MYKKHQRQGIACMLTKTFWKKRDQIFYKQLKALFACFIPIVGAREQITIRISSLEYIKITEYRQTHIETMQLKILQTTEYNICRDYSGCVETGNKWNKWNEQKNQKQRKIGNKHIIKFFWQKIESTNSADACEFPCPQQPFMEKTK